ncbi:histidine--tRNA ligase [Paraphotobacterium marinum]|uniref:histidine--tRNA ligase n=1 Tax=Paraphotobacterium marinum TaxID=1755811 RepID=UPI0039EA401E
MKNIYQAIRGMNDILPDKIKYWSFLENKIRRMMMEHNFFEIRTPLLEKTQLFQRSVGESTDVVEKEMYSFNDKSNENISLRPEGTAGCIRAVIQHGLIHNQEQKLWYMGPMYRYERPQKGRYRQFHQFGVEVFGIEAPYIEVEILGMLNNFFINLGLGDFVKLQINTIGNTESREAYKKALKTYFLQHIDFLDEDSKRRVYSNPLRILDSKIKTTQKIVENAPKFHSVLTENDKNEFELVCASLKEIGVSFEVNERLVRGLDYYNGVVFEWVTDALGAQGTVCGGGRYDGLVEHLGGSKTPGFGFGLGIERLVLMLESIDVNVNLPTIDIFVMTQNESNKRTALKLYFDIKNNFPDKRVFFNHNNVSFKRQFKKANSMGANFAVIIGDSEISNKRITLKNLMDGNQKDYPKNTFMSELREQLEA